MILSIADGQYVHIKLERTFVKEVKELAKALHVSNNLAYNLVIKYGLEKGYEDMKKGTKKPVKKTTSKKK